MVTTIVIFCSFELVACQNAGRKCGPGADMKHGYGNSSLPHRPARAS
jgi:hypothetical protein